MENLARETKRRRIYLGLKQVDLAAHGGPSHTTVREVETGARDSYSLETYDKLDRALRLRRGSARRALEGYPFEPLEDATTRRHNLDTRGLTDEEKRALENMRDAMRRKRQGGVA